MLGIDRTIREVTKWLDRPEWEDVLTQTYLDHVDQACERYDIDPHELEDEIGPRLFPTLYSCVVEDALVTPVREDEEECREGPCYVSKRPGVPEDRHRPQ